MREGEGSESDERWTTLDAVNSTAPNAVDSTASGAVDSQVLWILHYQVPTTFRPIQTSLRLHPPPSPRPNDPQ